MLAPAVARPLSSVIGRPLARLLGEPGKLGRENSMRSPRRTAQTASALMVGLALVSAIAVFGASLSRSATSSVDKAISADLIVTAHNGAGELQQLGASMASAVPGVTATTTVYGGPVRVPGLAVQAHRGVHGAPVQHRDPAHDVGHASRAGRRRAAHRLDHGQTRTTSPSATPCR